MYTVYAIYNIDAGRLYIGQTKDILRRLKEHNQPGRHYTQRFQGRWELIYKESAATRSEALKREKELKSYQGRAFIKSHIKTFM